VNAMTKLEMRRSTTRLAVEDLEWRGKHSTRVRRLLDVNPSKPGKTCRIRTPNQRSVMKQDSRGLTDLAAKARMQQTSSFSAVPFVIAFVKLGRWKK
jgi:hypothetical protein